MRRWRCLLMVFAVAVAAQGLVAEEITFFRASTAGPDVWAWDGAKVKQSDGIMVVREGNKAASFGSAYVDSRLPYFENGKVSYEVGALSGGNYSIQIMFFQGDSYISSVDLVKKASAPTSGSISLSDVKVPEGADGISLKVWIADLEGAQIQLSELSYSVPLEGHEVLLDEKFMSSSTWSLDGLVWKASGPPPVVGLDDVAFGSMHNKQRMTKSSGIKVAMQLPQVEQGVVTLQAVGFEGGTGEYVESGDLLKDVGAGWHLISLDKAPFPPQADEFELKLWVSGGAETTVSLGRILVLK